MSDIQVFLHRLYDDTPAPLDPAIKEDNMRRFQVRNWRDRAEMRGVRR